MSHITGHKTIKVTERYAHLSPEHQREAMGKLSRTEQEEALLPMDPELLAKALRGRLPVEQLEALVDALTATATRTATSPRTRATIPMFSGN